MEIKNIPTINQTDPGAASRRAETPVRPVKWGKTRRFHGSTSPPESEQKTVEKQILLEHWQKTFFYSKISDGLHHTSIHTHPLGFSVLSMCKKQQQQHFASNIVCPHRQITFTFSFSTAPQASCQKGFWSQQHLGLSVRKVSDPRSTSCFQLVPGSNREDIKKKTHIHTLDSYWARQELRQRGSLVEIQHLYGRPDGPKHLRGPRFNSHVTKNATKSFQVQC